ncbi:MAG: uroporphyrinogen-III C-methyltransferase [Paracoccaceae bacterium]|nr:uroporphyrinogen-III C-methyltransferase [Paracoccaceae bacterium]MDE2915039.1 uroporphyrinogen-III C-methyltransferase [Paracoccaceae bacterium]
MDWTRISRAAALPVFEPGWVWLCGAGPGDPGLLTLHALNGLDQADVIVHDALVDRQILDLAKPGSEVIHAGKRGGKPSPKQHDISLRLIELASSGRRVLRLKGGDPFVFGRGGEEALALVRSGHPIRIIPGISAGIGGLAYAGIPVTHRDVNQSVTFVTGHDQSGDAPHALDWAAIADASPVIVLYMALKNIAGISSRLIDAGRAPDESVAVITAATTPDQRILETTLSQAALDIDAAGMTAPAVICIGRAVLFRQALDWLAAADGIPPRDLFPLGDQPFAEAS